MKVLITGVKGQLGYDIAKECRLRNIDVIGVGIEEMDITDSLKVENVIKNAKVDAVIHCAAWTAVDQAEEEEELCRKINKEGTANIAKVCKELEIPVMYFSTDYVFDGKGEKPWQEYSPCAPLNVYGQTKYEGELEILRLEKFFILRISWVFGVNGHNFVKTMLRMGEEREAVNVVDDQVGSPTYSYDLAKLCVAMIQTDKYGIYHATNQGYCSWYEYACEIFRQAGMNVKVMPVASSMFPVKAKRPRNSRMSQEQLEKNGFNKLPDWKDALKRYLHEINMI